MTLDPTAAHQAVDALVAQASTEQAQAVAAQQATDQAIIDQQAAKIAELEAEINPTPPPAPDVIHWGINASSKPEHDAQLPLYGPEPLAWRYYHQAGERSTYPTEYTLRPGDIFVESDKVPPHQKVVSDLVTQFKAAPPDRPFVYCPWHEFEDDLANGRFTLAQLAQGFVTARQARDQAGTKNVFIACILMGYSWTPASKRNVESYLAAIGDANYDLITSDTYFAGPIGTAITTIPTAYDAQLATAAAHGKTWGVTEAGVGHKVSGQERLDAVTLLSKTIKAKLLGQKARTGPLLAQWFNVPNSSGAPGAWDLDAAGVAAWKAGQAA